MSNFNPSDETTELTMDELSIVSGGCHEKDKKNKKNKKKNKNKKHQNKAQGVVHPPGKKINHK